MKQIHVCYHKDGDYVSITETPWWVVLVEKIASYYNPRFGFDYKIWNWLFGLELGREKELLKLTIENGCTASRALYDEEFTCWRENCSNHEANTHFSRTRLR